MIIRVDQSVLGGELECVCTERVALGKQPRKALSKDTKYIQRTAAIGNSRPGFVLLAKVSEPIPRKT